MANPKRAQNGKPWKQPREGAYVRSVTGQSTEGTPRGRGPSTHTRIAEITSGRAISQQGLAITCKDSSTKATTVGGERDLVWRMGPYERRRRGNSCRRDTGCCDAKGNTWSVQRGPGYLAAPGPAPGLEPGQAVVLKSRSEFRMQTTGERGVHEPAFKPPWRWAGSGRTSQGQNRTREIRPSGIAGGPRETWLMVEL